MLASLPSPGVGAAHGNRASKASPGTAATVLVTSLLGLVILPRYMTVHTKPNGFFTFTYYILFSNTCKAQAVLLCGFKLTKSPKMPGDPGKLQPARVVFVVFCLFRDLGGGAAMKS